MNKPDKVSLPDWNILLEKYPNNISDIAKKINDGYPVQYLIGNVEFLNTIINVDSRVLIPRFETEGLVDKTIKYAKNMFNYSIDIVDLGTGSGCIAIALSKNLDAKVTAIDISKDAIELAKENSVNNSQVINFKNQDLLAPLDGDYDIIISNPPYIKEDGYVDKSVLDYEPHLALFAKDSGIFYYKEILQRHLSNLKKPGLIAFEIGDGQQDLLEQVLVNYPHLRHQFEKDLNGMIRYLFIFDE